MALPLWRFEWREDSSPMEPLDITAPPRRNEQNRRVPSFTFTIFYAELKVFEITTDRRADYNCFIAAIRGESPLELLAEAVNRPTTEREKT